MEKEIMKKLERVNKKGRMIAAMLEDEIGAEVKVSNDTEEITFDLFVAENRYDYFKIAVKYDENKKVSEYLRELLELIEEEDYYYYEASKMEREIKDFLKDNLVDDCNVYEGSLWTADGEEIDLLDIDGYELNKKDKTLTLIYDDEKCIVRFGSLFEETTVEWVDVSTKCEECEILKKEIDELNEIIEEIRDELSSVRKEKRELKEKLENKQYIIDKMLKDIMN